MNLESNQEKSLLEKYNEEMDAVIAEIDGHNKKKEIFDHVTFINLIVMAVLYFILETPGFVVASMVPFSIVFFVLFLKYRKLEKVAKYHKYFLKVLFEKNYSK